MVRCLFDHIVLALRRGTKVSHGDEVTRAREGKGLRGKGRVNSKGKEGKEKGKKKELACLNKGSVLFENEREIKGSSGEGNDQTPMGDFEHTLVIGRNLHKMRVIICKGKCKGKGKGKGVQGRGSG